jgi:hypothetical protein
MSVGFRAVQWNQAKLVYDGILLAGVGLYVGSYLMLAYWLDPPRMSRLPSTCAFARSAPAPSSC